MASSSGLKRFPLEVRTAMARSGSAATCVPVSLDGGAPEAALFLDLGGGHSRADRRLLRRWQGALNLALDAEAITTGNGAVIMLRPEVALGPGEPLAFEVLLTPGAGGTHFECLDLLCRQPRLAWFFGDRGHEVVRSQSHPLGAEHHGVFGDLRSEALGHDTMVRMTSRYDAGAALAEVVGHYRLREDVPGPGG